MATISLCMIVKNEEEVLERCLTSLEGLMDEVIIVDTGSSDGTREIAKKYATVFREFEWNDDFSEARNFAISLASCDYIYFADADEVLDEENREEFKKLKQVLMPEVEIVQMLYSGQCEGNTVYNFDEEYRPKLFKRLRSFQFQDPVHETLRTDPIVFDSDIRIFHRPHGKHTARDMEIFEKYYGGEESPLLPLRLARMYAKELFISGTDENFIGAIPIFERAIFNDDFNKEMIMYGTCVLVHAYRISGNDAEFFKYALQATPANSCSEVCMDIGRYFEDHGDFEGAEIWYYYAACETEPLCNIHMGGDIPLLALARISDKKGLPEQAEEYRKMAAKAIEDLG